MTNRPLSIDYLRSVLRYEPETGRFINLRQRAHRCGVRTEAGTLIFSGTNTYRRIIIKYQRYFAHRLAWFYVHGRWPEREIDHINGDGTDNRLSNLREATSSQNKANRKRNRNNRSGLKGVHWDRTTAKWRAEIMGDGKRLRLGRFNTKEAAYAAYCRAATRLHGAFARTK